MPMEKAGASGNGREKAVREQMEQERGNDGDIHPAWTRTNFSRQQPGHQIEYQAGDRNGRGNFLRSPENGISRSKQVRPEGKQVDEQPQQERYGCNGQNDGGGFRHGADSITPVRPPATPCSAGAHPLSAFARTRLGATGSSRRHVLGLKGTQSPAGTQRRYHLLRGIQRHSAAWFLVCFGGAPPRTPPRAVRCFTRSRTGSWRNREPQKQSCSRPADGPTSMRSCLLGLCVRRRLCVCKTPAPVRSMGASFRRGRGATRAFPSRCPARRRTRCGGRRRRGGRGRGRGSRAARCRCSSR